MATPAQPSNSERVATKQFVEQTITQRSIKQSHKDKRKPLRDIVKHARDAIVSRLLSNNTHVLDVRGCEGSRDRRPYLCLVTTATKQGGITEETRRLAHAALQDVIDGKEDTDTLPQPKRARGSLSVEEKRAGLVMECIKQARSIPSPPKLSFTARPPRGGVAAPAPDDVRKLVVDMRNAEARMATLREEQKESLATVAPDAVHDTVLQMMRRLDISAQRIQLHDKTFFLRRKVSTRKLKPKAAETSSLLKRLVCGDDDAAFLGRAHAILDEVLSFMTTPVISEDERVTLAKSPSRGAKTEGTEDSEASSGETTDEDGV